MQYMDTLWDAFIYRYIKSNLVENPSGALSYQTYTSSVPIKDCTQPMYGRSTIFFLRAEEVLIVRSLYENSVDITTSVHHAFSMENQMLSNFGKMPLCTKAMQQKLWFVLCCKTKGWICYHSSTQVCSQVILLFCNGGSNS